MKRAYSRLRAGDEAASRIVTQFLETYFYHPFTTEYQFHNDVSTQVMGIDTTFVLNGRRYMCDEKAAVRYMNKRLNTFALELSFINRANQYQDGWLVSTDKCNDSFMFIWLDQVDAPNTEAVQHHGQFRNVEFALVRRDAIIEYLRSLGWTLPKLRKKCERLRNFVSETTGDIYYDGCKFTVSYQLVERPVNVLLSRRKLIELSDYANRIIF